MSTLTRGQFHLHVYVQLLCKKVLKMQKAACFDCLLGSAREKAARKMMVKLTLGQLMSALKNTYKEFDMPDSKVLTHSSGPYFVRYNRASL